MIRNYKNTFLVFIGVVGFILFSTPSIAKADTYISMVNGNPCITSWVDLVNRTYTPPTLDITAQWQITNDCGVDVPVTLRAVNDVHAVAPAVNPSATFQPIITLPGNHGQTGGGFISQDTTSFDAPSGTGTYKIQFETGVDYAVGVFQNYWETDDGGAITDICSSRSVVSYGPPIVFQEPTYYMHRDAQSEASATARGKTHVVTQVTLQTDNYPSPCSRIVQADFYPGDLDVQAYMIDGIMNSDFTCGDIHNYCAGFHSEGTSGLVITEY